MKKLLAWLMAVTLTFQLVTPVFAEEIEETQTATEAVEMETEAPTTEIPTTEPTTTDAMETAAPEETSAPTEPQPTTEVTEATEATAPTEETTTASTEPTEETTEPTLDLFADSSDYSLQLRRIDELYSRIQKNGGFFTVNQAGCGIRPSRDENHSKCDNCKLGNVVKSEWFTTEFGANISCNQFAMNRSGEAWSCVAFASFAGWFVNRGDDSDIVSTESKDTGNFSYDFLINHARPGDCLRMGGAHSAIFISCDQNNVYVLDSNWTSVGGYYCAVRKHSIPYSRYQSVTISHLKSKQGGHTHNYVLGYETAHPHQEYMKCESCGDMYYTHTGKTATVDDCVQCETMPELWGVCGDNLIWKIEGPFGEETMTISGTGDMWDFAYPRGSGDNLLAWDRKSYSRIIICEGVTSVGNGAFYSKGYIRYLQLPSTLIRIGDEAFAPSDSADFGIKGTLTLPSGLKSIGKNAFRGCSGLTGDLIIPDSVTEIGTGAFEGCTGFQGKLVLSKNLTNIDDYTFEGCGFTGSLYFPDGLKNIGKAAFESCAGFTGGLTFPRTLETIGDSAFNYCQGLNGTLSFPDDINSIGKSAFYKDSSLTGTLSLPKNLISLGSHAFVECKGFTGDLILPDGVTSIGEGAFDWCTGFSGTLKLSKELQTIGGRAFYYCNGFTNLAPLPEKLVSIGDDAFAWCSGLTGELVFSNGLQTIGDSAFYDCGFTGDLILPDSLVSIGDMAFWKCKGFAGKLVLSSSLVSIGSSAFNECKGFTGSLILPESLRTIGSNAFDTDCEITSLTIPNSVLDWGNHSLSFHSLKSLTMPGELQNSPVNSWQGLETLTLTGSRVKRLSSDALYYGYGRNAKKIILSEGITEVEQEAFADCYDTEQLSLPKSLKTIEEHAFWGCSSLKDVYYNGSKSDWKRISIAPGNENLTGLTGATLHYNSNGNESPSSIEIRPVNTTSLTSGGKLTLTAWAMPDNKKAKVKWSLSEDSKAYAAISSSGVLTAKAVSEVQNITVIAAPTDGSPEARKEIQILPKITVKQVDKFNLFHSYSRAELAITGGTVDCALLDGNKDFVLENENDHFYIRFANPENPPAKPNTRATLQVFFPGSDTPAIKALTISTTNTAPKLKLNPTSSILNTTLVGGLTVEAEVLGTEDESLNARSTTKGVTASIKSGKLVVTLDTKKTTTATVYLKGNDWAKEVKLTHRITVTEKKPTVKFTAKGKLDVLNPASEIIYTPKLTNATGTITGVQLTGEDAKLFNAEVVDGLVHLTMKADCKYATKKTYKVTPVVTLLGKNITGPTLSIKVTQGAMKLAKIPNQTVSKSHPGDLTVYVQITSPAWADIDRMKLDDKSSAAFRDAFECFHFVGGAVTFPASTFAPLKPGRYTVILDVFPANAASDTKPIQAKFTLTVQK